MTPPTTPDTAPTASDAPDVAPTAPDVASDAPDVAPDAPDVAPDAPDVALGAAPAAAGVAAVVGERVIAVAEVDARLAALRAGPLADRLPRPGTAEFRNTRRWLLQAMIAEHLVARAANRLHLTIPVSPLAASASPAPASPPAASPSAGSPSAGSPSVGVSPAVTLTLAAALRTGGVAAAVLMALPLAGAVCDAVAAPDVLPEDEVEDYYRRNSERFTTPETRWVSDLGPVRRGEVPRVLEDAVFAASEGERIGPVDAQGGPWTLTVRRVQPARRQPYEDARETIRAELAEARRMQAFTRWLDETYAADVRLMPGYEHPADPSQPDATHRH